MVSAVKVPGTCVRATAGCAPSRDDPSAQYGGRANRGSLNLLKESESPGNIHVGRSGAGFEAKDAGTTFVHASLIFITHKRLWLSSFS